MSSVSKIPVAPPIEEPRYVPFLLGKRVRHKHLDIFGRLTGEVRHSRGTMWVEADTETAKCWWLAANLFALGPIPIPCPPPPKRSA